MLIGQLSTVTGCSPHQLRYYESQDLLEPERGLNGYRRYSPDAPERVAWIRALIDIGVPTREMRRLLPFMSGTADVNEWSTLWPTLHDRLLAVEEQIHTLRNSHLLITECLAQISAPTEHVPTLLDDSTR